jgi:hypothetical protein
MTLSARLLPVGLGLVVLLCPANPVRAQSPNAQSPSDTVLLSLPVGQVILCNVPTSPEPAPMQLRQFRFGDLAQLRIAASRGPALPLDSAEQGKARALAAGCWPLAGAAQRLPETLQPIRPPAAESVRVYAPSYWIEGATISAAVLGATTVFVAAGFCEFGDAGTPCRASTYVASAAIGGVVGAGLGALVGGVFDAPHARPLRGHPGRAALIGAVGGAVWSVGFLCHGLGDGCGRSEPVFGFSVSLAGALAGWLVGS